MTVPACTEEEFIQLYRALQSTQAIAKHLSISTTAVQARRRRVEKKHGIILPLKDYRAAYNTAESSAAIAKLEISDGIIMVGSDAHIWPGHRSTMQRAFIKFAKRFKPAAIVANGDFFDGASISRHASIGWESRPSVAQELEAVQDYMGDLAQASPGSKRIWPLGNHDMRFEAKIANTLPELAKVEGVHLKDHFPQWLPCWRLDVNDDIVIRHRELGGEHADFRNVVTTGKTVVTGHDHRANVTAYRNYSGQHWGVRCGFMADSSLDSQFVHYLEAREPNWNPAFVFLTFKDRRMLWPELVNKFDDDHVEFRGEVIAV